MPSSLPEVLPFTCRVFSVPTCVGLRYGRNGALPRGFSWRSRRWGLHRSFERLGTVLTVPSSGAGRGICLPPLGYDRPRILSNRCALPTSPRPPVGQTRPCGTGILTSCPSPTPCGLGLGPTNPEWIILPQEPWGLRWRGFSPRLALLIPAFALPCAPALLPVDLLCCRGRSPTMPPRACAQGDHPRLRSCA